MSGLLRNGSGYVDMTAFKALTSIEREEKDMTFRRGDIFIYETKGGSLNYALIVSANFRGKDHYQNIILLSEESKEEYCVEVSCRGKKFAHCDNVSMAIASRFGDFVRCATEAEMEAIDEGMAKCLGIEPKIVEKEIEKAKTDTADALKKLAKVPSVSEEVAKWKAKAEVFEGLYKEMLAKVMGE